MRGRLILFVRSRMRVEGCQETRGVGHLQGAPYHPPPALPPLTTPNHDERPHITMGGRPQPPTAPSGRHPMHTNSPKSAQPAPPTTPSTAEPPSLAPHTTAASHYSQGGYGVLMMTTKQGTTPPPLPTPKPTRQTTYAADTDTTTSQSAKTSTPHHRCEPLLTGWIWGANDHN
jgi:hypothetical protein